MRVATELARQATQLQEMELANRRLDQFLNQAYQQAKDAEDKASAAVTAISMVKILHQKKVKLNSRDSEKFWPETYTADRLDKKSFAEVLGEVETYLSVLVPGLLARPLLEWAAALRDQQIVMSDVEAYGSAHGNPFDWNLNFPSLSPSPPHPSHQKPKSQTNMETTKRYGETLCMNCQNG